jgi:hypothetical protein
MAQVEEIRDHLLDRLSSSILRMIHHFVSWSSA